MISNLGFILKESWGIPDFLLEKGMACEKRLGPFEAEIEERAQRNFLKVLKAFRDNGAKESHLYPSFGYGYFDAGREVLERIFAQIFGGEDALVRLQFVSGTHVLRCALFGLLRPGNELLVVPSPPYDTLHPLLGLRASRGSLAEWGVVVRTASVNDLLDEKIAFTPKMKVLLIQRSKGYAWQDSLSIATIEKLIAKAKKMKSDIRVVVDNCYGEFVEEQEPCDVGADLVCGSLIKNPGGALALTGGYLVGKSECVEEAGAQLTAPGLGKEVGATLGMTRHFLAGIFMAPTFVGEALKTALFASALFHDLGYLVLPLPHAKRTDTIQAIQLGSLEKLLAFARGIQSAGPLDSYAKPEGAPLAGYADSIVMAGGSFVQGGSLELSCDAPLRPPYIAYLQGGIFSTHGKLGVLLAGAHVLKVASHTSS
jgi:cystathionine beta-lyase family protein involved in aluminum resistance